ncbi:MAG: LysR family transcriptional regulator [Proteobacteria bacterium]|nr:LysR family transcriptional regulator [Pseudomonadota bacterium]
MNWADFPSLNSLKAFSALAESGSYTKAGAALNVSHAAVSQQVKALEARLGTTLVARNGRGIALTEEGTALARDLQAGFTAIRRGVEALTGLDSIRPVQVTTSSAFAVMWLMPRIVDFQTRHPDITLMLNPTSQIIELKPGGVDLAIRYRDSHKLDRKVEAVLVADMVVVGTPALIGEREITDPAMLVEMPWLQELGTNEVADWLARRGVTLERPLMISHMPGNLIMEAVRRGDGITYTVRPFVEKEIKSGQLIELFADKAFGTFYIQTPPGVPRPPVKAFVQWLKQQAAVDPASNL